MKVTEHLGVLQKKITSQLQEDVDRLMGVTPKSIRTYEKELIKDFKSLKSFPKKTSKDELIRKIRSHSITLVADYHTYAQAQRTALRLIREAMLPNEKWALALEMCSSDQQTLLDQLCSKKISIEEFLEELDYENKWGFPWAHYAPLIEWALEHSIPIYGLNRPENLDPLLKSSKKETDLTKRDIWAAGILTDLVVQKKFRVLALYGEFHLARAHLPKQIEAISKTFSGKPVSVLTVHQNYDDYYWKLAEKKAHHETHTLKMREHEYCILSGTPWNKLQSVISWADGFSEETEIDATSSLVRNVEHLSEFFRLAVPNTTSIEVKTLDDAELFHEKNSLVTKLISVNQRFFLPETGTFYAAQVNPNHLADLAASFLFARLFKIKSFTSGDAETLYRLTTQSAFSFFGSLVLNPKRKCDLLKDHENHLRELKSKRKPAFRDEKAARSAVISFFKTRDWSTKYIKEWKTSRGLSLSIFLASRWIGEIIGKRLYQAMLSDELELTELRSVLMRKNMTWKEKDRKLIAWAMGTSFVKSKKDLL